MQFNAIIEKDENGYFAYVPEMKGCISQGDTFEEALANIKEAAVLYLSSLEEGEKESIVTKTSFIASLNIDVPKSELLKRAKKRAETSDRKDDINPEIHIKRIEIFEESTRPAIEYMKSKIEVLTFDGLGTIDEITKRIKASL